MCVWTTFLSFFHVAVRIGHFFFRFSVCVGLILFVFCLIANFKITNSKLIFFYQGLILKHSCVKYICLIWNFYVYVTMVIMMFFLIFFSWTLSSWCWPRTERPPSGRTAQLSQKNKIQKNRVSDPYSFLWYRIQPQFWISIRIQLFSLPCLNSFFLLLQFLNCKKIVDLKKLYFSLMPTSTIYASCSIVFWDFGYF